MLQDILSSIRTVEDITTLFSALGYDAADLPFTRDTQTVARWKGFKVVAAERTCSRDGARDLALEISRTAERAVAVVLSRNRELAIAAPRFVQPGTTRILAVSIDNPSNFALEQLKRLSPKNGSTALSHALSVADVLSSEEVGERFFTQFKVHLERMTVAIDRRRSASDRRMVALINLSRILFLYFVQAKGWLDGRSDYLKLHLDCALARRRNFHGSVLRPLFFETLNLPPDRRT